jgi:threonine synthase
MDTMKFVSTRDKAPTVSFLQAVEIGWAADGALYVPETIPQRDMRDFPATLSLPEFAARLLRPFVAEEGEPAHVLEDICAAAWNFPVPLKDLARQTAVLELGQGPTAAFKDFSARFFAEFVSRRAPAERTVIVATSGDTGGAVAAAFDGKPGTKVIILYPKGHVSERQEHQLCWGGSVTSFSVDSDFDECQRLVSEAFGSAAWREQLRLTSANSINIGRVLPQAIYYAWSAVQYQARHGAKPSFSIPSGNLGSSTGALWARMMGFPIDKLALAFSSNRALPRYLETGKFAPTKLIPSLAHAMDVGNPANFHRMNHFFPTVEGLRAQLMTYGVDDDVIRQTMIDGPKNWGEVWCPHTACAVHVREQQDSPHWIIVSTAHPAKFETIVEPLIGRKVEIPPGLAATLERSASKPITIKPTLAELGAHVGVK